jgi:hypothetical protein
MEKFFDTIYLGFIWIRDVLLMGQWNRFWDWIKIAHSSSDEASSKRFYGGIIVINCIIILYLFSAGVFKLIVWTNIAPYWIILLVSGLGLISLSVLEKIIQLITELKIKQIPGSNPTVNPEVNSETKTQ